MSEFEIDRSISRAGADEILKFLKTIPKPDNVSDGRKARSLGVVRSRVRKLLERVINGQEPVPLGALCSEKTRFLNIVGEKDFYVSETQANVCVMIGEFTQTFLDTKEMTEGAAEDVGSKISFELEDGVIAESPAMRKIFELVEILANRGLTVLVEGETGTGKEVVARALHYRSKKREDEKFIPVNCAAIPSELLESMLFGHKKGAFTGASRDHNGLLEEVGNGTIFLDEIGDMDPRLQAKLLRVLQEKTFMPIGHNKEVPFAGRVVCATNKNLAEAVKDGTFREDLYYRITQFKLNIPPLRERPEDTRALIEKIVSGFEGVVEIKEEAIEKILSCKLPGNVRELEGVLVRAEVLASLHNGHDKVTLLQDDIDVDTDDIDVSQSEEIPEDQHVKDLMYLFKDLIEKLRPLSSYHEVSDENWFVIELAVDWCVNYKKTNVKDLASQLGFGERTFYSTVKGKRRASLIVKSMLAWLIECIDEKL